MRIGLINELHGDGSDGSPTWPSLSKRAELAESVGFDLFVFEDAFIYRTENGPQGVWDSVAIGAALAAITEDIRIAHSVINSPYRSPTLTASVALTLDEISGGRYTLGIGAGNTSDYDYEAVGVPADHRFSRFAEAIEIIHSLLERGSADLDGRFYSVSGAEIVLRPTGGDRPPINIAAGGPKMLELVAKYGDEWNWWGYDEPVNALTGRLAPLVETLEDALDREGRDRRAVVRTLDLYSVAAPGSSPADWSDRSPVSGSPEQLTEYIAALAELGFEEVRCEVLPKTLDAVEAMAPVVAMVHDL